MSRFENNDTVQYSPIEHENALKVQVFLNYINVQGS